jgi:2-alkyl-3-oxoalkanoate reductase
VVDDDPAPVAEWLPYLAQVAGAKPPLRVPAWLGRLLAGEFIVAEVRDAPDRPGREFVFVAVRPG